MFKFKKTNTDSEFLKVLEDEYLADKNQKTAAALYKYLARFEVFVPMKAENYPDIYLEDDIWYIPVYSTDGENREKMLMKDLIVVREDLLKLGKVYLKVDDRIYVNEAFIKYMKSVGR